MTEVLAVTPTLVATAVEANKHDPWVTGLFLILAGIAILMVILIMVARPVLSLLKEARSNTVDSAKSDAESYLYTQLKDQVESMMAEINSLKLDREAWFKKAFEMQGEVDRLKQFEKNFESMRQRLNAKDKIIEERDTEVRRLMALILDMKDRIHQLEVRIIKDEQLGLLQTALGDAAKYRV